MPSGGGRGSYDTVPDDPSPDPLPAPKPKVVPAPAPTPAPLPQPAPSPKPELRSRPNEKTKPDPKSKPDPKPKPDLKTKPKPRTDDDQRKRKPHLGRIYVTYLKIQDQTGLVYTGRTDMVVNLDLPLLPQALLAMYTRGLRHHKDETGYSPASIDDHLDTFDVGTAVNRDFRYRDRAYLQMRGREQQSIDAYGGSWSDTDPKGLPRRTGNEQRAVDKDNPWGRRFHDAATRKWGELHPYTGR